MSLDPKTERILFAGKFSATKSIWVYGYHFTDGATGTVQFFSGARALTGAMDVAALSGMVVRWVLPIHKCSPGEAFNVTLVTAGADIQGSVSYRLVG